MWRVIESDVLCHYGVRGQKWGVRKYQNPDGSLNDAGRKRYARKSIRTRNLEIELARSRKKDRAKAERKKDKMIGISVSTAVSAATLVAGYALYRHEINDCVRAIKNVSVSQL